MQLLRNFVFIEFLASLLVADCFVYQRGYMKDKCGTKQFQCNSEQCIDDWKQCDGVNNCADGSDETTELCSSLKCPPFSFKCAYGACIYSNLECNGVKNCRDNSDEEWCLGIPLNASFRTSRLNVEIPPGNDCVLPEHPDYGKWLVLSSSIKELLPGDIVPESTSLLFNCETNYKLLPDVTLARCNKTFGDLPKCIKYCPPLFGNNLTLSCSRDGSAMSCENAYEGTRAVVRCTSLYEVPSQATGPFRFCNDGSWDNWLPKCEQVCGVSSVKAQKLTTGYQDLAGGDFPWHIVIYRNIELVCVGSLITPRLVLTVAHCFNLDWQGSYLIAAGKGSTHLNNTNGDQPQYSKISDIIFHEDYKKGRADFDLVVVVLASPFKLTKYVMPVCLDLSKKFDMSSLINKVGIEVGWALKLTDADNKYMRYLMVEYKAIDKCNITRLQPNSYIAHLPDKFCATNHFQEFLTAGPVGLGNGGGLVFPDDNGIYFLRGVASGEGQEALKRHDEGWLATTMTLYTSLQYHIDLIKKSMKKYRV